MNFDLILPIVFSSLNHFYSYNNKYNIRYNIGVLYVSMTKIVLIIFYLLFGSIFNHYKNGANKLYIL